MKTSRRSFLSFLGLGAVAAVAGAAGVKVAVAIEKLVRPPFVASDFYPFTGSILPGHVTYYDAAKVETIWALGPLS